MWKHRAATHLEISTLGVSTIRADSCGALVIINKFTCQVIRNYEANWLEIVSFSTPSRPRAPVPPLRIFLELQLQRFTTPAALFQGDCISAGHSHKSLPSIQGAAQIGSRPLVRT